MVSIVKDGENDASNYMPVRAVLEGMGYSVAWDSSKNAVIVNDKKDEKTQQDNITKSTISKSYELVPMYLINSKKYNGDRTELVYIQDSKLFLSLAMCPYLISICNSDYTVNFDNAKFSDGTIKFNNINKYIDSKQIEKNIRDSYGIYTIQNGGKKISYDESKEDNYPMTIIQGHILVPITELKNIMGIEFEYIIDDVNGTIIFSNIRSN